MTPDRLLRSTTSLCATCKSSVPAELWRVGSRVVMKKRCATHGAAYLPETGECAGGPCRGGLVKITLTESDGMVRWHTAHLLKPVLF